MYGDDGGCGGGNGSGDVFGGISDCGGSCSHHIL